MAVGLAASRAAGHRETHFSTQKHSVCDHPLFKYTIVYNECDPCKNIMGISAKY